MALSWLDPYIKASALWALGRVGEQPAAMAEAEATARALADPLILSEVLVIRATQEAAEGRRGAETVAAEALRWASEAGDRWAIAMAAQARAVAAGSAAELRERVDRAASLLHAVGNVYILADLLASAAYGALRNGSDRDAKAFVDRAIPLTGDLDHPFLWMLLRGNIGLVALLTGDTDAARHAFREELTLSRQLVVFPLASEGLLGLAAVATVRGDLDRAARLSGAAAAHRYERPEDAVDTRLDAAFFQPARSRHGAKAWDAAARDGAALSVTDAITYALDEPRQTAPNPTTAVDEGNER